MANSTPEQEEFYNNALKSSCVWEEVCGGKPANIPSFLTARRKVNIMDFVLQENAFFLRHCPPFISSLPFAFLVYGPSGSGKTALLQHMLSCGELGAYSTVIVVHPSSCLVDPAGVLCWKTCAKDAVSSKQDCAPVKNVPVVKTMNFPEYEKLCTNDSSDTGVSSAFIQLSKEGPMLVVLDDCMDDISKSKNGALFHSVLTKTMQNSGCPIVMAVTLHNLFPSSNGAMSTLKSMAKASAFHYSFPYARMLEFTRRLGGAYGPIEKQYLEHQILLADGQGDRRNFFLHHSESRDKWARLSINKGTEPFFLPIVSLYLQFLNKITPSRKRPALLAKEEEKSTKKNKNDSTQSPTGPVDAPKCD